MNQVYLVFAIAAGIFFIWLISLEIRFYNLRKRWERIFQGKSAEDLEFLMRTVTATSALHEQRLFEHGNRITTIEEFLPRVIQRIRTIRFNPFRDTGGDQSFSVALLDGEDNGVVISSLYARDGNRVYAKPIEKGTSKIELLQEEREVLTGVSAPKKRS